MRRGRTATTGFFRSFREFALKGNVVDLAVAVIIGGAFGKIVTSFVEDLVMPGLINPVLAKTGSDWRTIVVGPGIKLGNFLGSVVDFLIIAFVIFLVVQAIEKFKRKEAIAEPEPIDPVLQAQERLADATERLTQVIESRSM